MSNIKPRIRCADGVSLSVQASDSHYCTPRENADWHSHVEVGYIEDESGEKLTPPESWREHGDGEFPSSVYAYVPIEKVGDFIESHGGVVSENCLTKMKTLTRGDSPLSATTCSPVLCYVEEQWAYFTTKKLSEQWGDDWDDIPYEHNAGEPYTYRDHDKKEGCDPWEIVKVAWEGDFETPCAHQLNSQWSVERINEGGIAWMQTSSWKSGESVIIRAGTTLSDFCRLVAEGGGKVYLENAKGEPLA